MEDNLYLLELSNLVGRSARSGMFTITIILTLNQKTIIYKRLLKVYKEQMKQFRSHTEILDEMKIL